MAGNLIQAEEGQASELAALEALCFPPDEAASLETIRMRLAVARRWFRVLLTPNSSNDDSTRSLVGFINGTLCSGAEIEHDSMTTHDSKGDTLVIHSVSVAPTHRRKGLGLQMLASYVKFVVEEAPELRRIMLLSKPLYLNLYLKAGFQVLRKSPVVHGADEWLELSLDLTRARQVHQHIIDAFTSAAFKGNPAAVVFLDKQHGDRSDEWMQSLAAENNLAETAFLRPMPPTTSQDGVFEFSLRWFTPTVEVALCGHATLAAAHFLVSTGRVPRGIGRIDFHTVHSGTLAASCSSDGLIELDFPAQKSTALALEEFEYRDALVRALPGVADLQREVLFLGRADTGDLLVELRQESLVVGAKIVIAALAEIPGRGVIITSRGGPSECDFVSRCFFPNMGVPEDPVTGSAHCTLAVHYGGQGQKMRGYQASKRGGIVGVQVVADRVKLQGNAVTVIEGRLT